MDLIKITVCSLATVSNNSKIHGKKYCPSLFCVLASKVKGLKDERRGLHLEMSQQKKLRMSRRTWPERTDQLRTIFIDL